MVTTRAATQNILKKETEKNIKLIEWPENKR